tara:strand:- start:5 stop:190 length:186 start_codon:yes stop_codon:yes gene_type:complete
MAKFTRNDPLNKKEGRTKSNSLDKDLRIREVGIKDNSKMLNEVMYDDEHDVEQLGNQPLQG